MSKTQTASKVNRKPYRAFNDIYERLFREGHSEELIAAAIASLVAAGRSFTSAQVKERLTQEAPITDVVAQFSQPAAALPSPMPLPMEKGIQERIDRIIANGERFFKENEAEILKQQEVYSRCQIGWGRLEDYPKEWQGR